MSIRAQLNLWGSKKEPFVFLIDFENKKPLAWRVADCPEDFRYDFQGLSNFPLTTAHYPPLKIEITPPNFKDYQAKFKETLSVLNRGDSFLMNLTTKGQIKTNRNLQQLFHEAQSKYKFMLANEFVCFSPETFIQIRGQQIHTFPMKGTIDAGLLHAESILLKDPKEKAEHATIVDLLRNDMSQVAKNVSVRHYRFYDEV